MRYLIIDDEELNRMILREFLETIIPHKILCDTANNGLTALKLINKSIKSGKTYDFIISDIQMPILDGVSFIKELRKLEKVYSEIDRHNIIVISGSNLKYEDQKYLNDQISKFIKKPIDLENLKKVLSTHIKNTGRNVIEDKK